MSEENITGSCLCGKAQFHVENNFEHFQLCHCRQCQQLSGTAYVSNLFIKKENFRWIQGSGFVKRYHHRERNFYKAFCMECGSTMPLESVYGETILVPAGSLDRQPDIKPEQSLFWHERMAWFDDVLSARQFENDSTESKVNFE